MIGILVLKRERVREGLFTGCAMTGFTINAIFVTGEHYAEGAL